MSGLKNGSVLFGIAMVCLVSAAIAGANDTEDRPSALHIVASGEWWSRDGETKGKWSGSGKLDVSDIGATGTLAVSGFPSTDMVILEYRQDVAAPGPLVGGTFSRVAEKGVSGEAQQFQALVRGQRIDGEFRGPDGQSYDWSGFWKDDRKGNR